eukprot:364639-Chlamydomonas_euryale.AAC.25
MACPYKVLITVMIVCIWRMFLVWADRREQRKRSFPPARSLKSGSELLPSEVSRINPCEGVVSWIGGTCLANKIPLSPCAHVAGTPRPCRHFAAKHSRRLGPGADSCASGRRLFEPLNSEPSPAWAVPSAGGAAAPPASRSDGEDMECHRIEHGAVILDRSVLSRLHPWCELQHESRATSRAAAPACTSPGASNVRTNALGSARERRAGVAALARLYDELRAWQPRRLLQPRREARCRAGPWATQRRVDEHFQAGSREAGRCQLSLPEPRALFRPVSDRS